MTAGGLKPHIVLCAIGIFDLPYIFENFAPQFSENHRGNRRVWTDFLAVLSTHGQDDESQNKYHFVSNNSSLLALDLPPYGWIRRLHTVCNERGAVISTADR
jgi:hypothetical protein